MSDKLQFAVQSRTKLGRQSNAVRRAGLVPGNISDGKVARAIAVDPKSFLSLFDKVGETGLFYVKVDAEQELVPVLVDSVQQHSVDNHLIHVALRQVNLTQKVTADIPIELQGVLAVKEAVALLVRNTVEVEALPLDLPEKFVIDISTLKAIGESITLGQLPHDKTTYLYQDKQLPHADTYKS
jgi:ribosomal protein bL25 (Ctc-form)